MGQPLTLTQTQIIQSLGEALSWFERELSWGVKAAELNHLTGRIGELYTAMITRGQMALKTNQRGYDVVSAEGERISVKTITTSPHALFNAETLDLVDRIIVLRLNVDDDHGVSIEELLDAPVLEARPMLGPAGPNKLRFAVSRRGPRADIALTQAMTGEAVFEGITIQRYESGHIRLPRNGEVLLPAKPVLRDIAIQLGVSLEAENGRIRTTHELGSHVLRQLALMRNQGQHC